MKLNVAKCEYVGVNIKKQKKDTKQMFPDETLMKRVGKTSYLGGNTYDNWSSKGEVEIRSSRAAIVFGKLEHFWSSDNSKKMEAEIVRIYGGVSIVLRSRKRFVKDCFGTTHGLLPRKMFAKHYESTSSLLLECIKQKCPGRCIHFAEWRPTEASAFPQGSL